VVVVSLTRRLAALIALLALVFGAPYLLWVLGRGFLPDRIPSLPQVWDALTTQDTGALFMGALVVVGFVAWAVFTACVLVDIAGRVAGRTWTLRILGLRVPQAAASSLVSAVLAGSVLLGMTGTATAQPLTPLPHVTADAPAAAGVAETLSGPRHAVITATRVPAARTAPVGPEWTVHEGDTLWSIAERPWATRCDTRRSTS